MVGGEFGRPGWWTERGYWGNPYDTRPLGATDTETGLLVGRERIRRELRAQLRASTAHPAISGPYGGGKTSLVRCLMSELETEARQFDGGELLVPAPDPLSPSGEENAKDFIERCLLHLGATLLRWPHQIAAAGGHVGDRVDALGSFIGKPILTSGGGGATVLGTGASGSAVTSLNTGFGFRSDGFGQLVRGALAEAFPADASGAMVACIDDIEAYGGTQKILSFLSEIREPLLKLPGVKWIVVGADEALDGVDQSPRLTGVVSALSGLSILSGDVVADVVERRIAAFHLGQTVVVPVNGTAFADIYERSGKHLRAALNLALKFAVYADDQGLLDSGGLIRAEEIDESGPWLRLDVPPDEVGRFLDQVSLATWDKVSVLGSVAGAVLVDLEGSGELDSELLIDGDPSRRTAVDRLAAKSFVSSTSSDAVSAGRIRLTSGGHLALGGARMAGQV